MPAGGGGKYRTAGSPPELRSSTIKVLRRVFERFDKDGSGGLSWVELAAYDRALGHEELSRETFDKIIGLLEIGDTSSSSELGFDGFVQLIELEYDEDETVGDAALDRVSALMLNSPRTNVIEVNEDDASPPNKRERVDAMAVLMAASRRTSVQPPPRSTAPDSIVVAPDSGVNAVDCVNAEETSLYKLHPFFSRETPPMASEDITQGRSRSASLLDALVPGYLPSSWATAQPDFPLAVSAAVVCGAPPACSPAKLVSSFRRRRCHRVESLLDVSATDPRPRLSFTASFRQSKENVDIDVVGIDTGVEIPDWISARRAERTDAQYPWTTTYRPMSASQVVGNSEAVSRMSAWLSEFARVRATSTSTRHAQITDAAATGWTDESSWSGDADDDDLSWGDDSDVGGNARHQRPQDRRCLIVCGPPAVGKTSAVHACAHELGFKVLELNASDDLHGSRLHARVGEAAQSHAMGRSTEELQACIILIDEVDVVAAEDERFVSSLRKFVHAAKSPVVVVCDDVTPAVAACGHVVAFGHLDPVEASRRVDAVCRVETGKAWLWPESDIRFGLTRAQFWAGCAPVSMSGDEADGDSVIGLPMIQSTARGVPSTSPLLRSASLPMVCEVQPSAAPPGARVKILGRGFMLGAGEELLIFFGEQPCTGVVVTSDTRCSVIVPAPARITYELGRDCGSEHVNDFDNGSSVPEPTTRGRRGDNVRYQRDRVDVRVEIHAPVGPRRALMVRRSDDSVETSCNGLFTYVTNIPIATAAEEVISSETSPCTVSICTATPLLADATTRPFFLYAESIAAERECTAWELVQEGSSDTIVHQRNAGLACALTRPSPGLKASWPCLVKARHRYRAASAKAGMAGRSFETAMFLQHMCRTELAARTLSVGGGTGRGRRYRMTGGWIKRRLPEIDLGAASFMRVVSPCSTEESNFVGDDEDDDGTGEIMIVPTVLATTTTTTSVS